MTERQIEMWDALCWVSDEDVARLFTNFYGNQLLDEELYEFMQDEGFL